MQVIRAVKEVRSFSYVRPAECIIDQQRRQKEEEGEGRFICQKVGGGPKEEEEGPGDMPASSPTDRRLGGGGDPRAKTDQHCAQGQLKRRPMLGLFLTVSQ